MSLSERRMVEWWYVLRAVVARCSMAVFVKQKDVQAKCVIVECMIECMIVLWCGKSMIEKYATVYIICLKC